MSCVIPMYNEEDNVDSILSESVDLFEQLSLDYEIIIVESGSTDSTWTKINEKIKGNRNIYAFHQDKKEGFGSALRLGYTKCTKDLVCHLEADSPFDITYFEKALPILIGNDCVIGYRVGKKEHNFEWSYHHMSAKNALLREVFHLGYNLMLKIVFGLNVKEVNFSFKIFRREHIQKLHLISNGWFLDAEIMLELKRHGILPIEVPVEYKDREGGRSTVGILSPIHILYEMFKYIKTRKEYNSG